MPQEKLRHQGWQLIGRIHYIKSAVHTGLLKMQQLFISAGTLPYYQIFHQNTVSPIKRIAQRVAAGADDEELTRMLGHWRDRKLYELHFIQLASTILAAAVIGCFSWAAISDGYWIGPALWYCSLVLSVFAILLSSTQSFIFTSLNKPTPNENSSGDYRRYLALITIVSTRPSIAVEESSPTQEHQICVPRWKMVFVWQCPMMFMAYAVCFFLIGLTIYICTPLLKGEFSSNGAMAAYFYLGFSVCSGGMFMYCSFWAYKFIDLEKVVHLD